MNQTDTAQVRHPDRLVLTIVERVAKREGIDAAELTPPLHDVVDTDALETLFASHRPTVERNDGLVSFRYCGYDVTIHADGGVDVDDGAGARDDAIARST